MIARKDLSHGRHGIIPAGSEIPATYLDDLSREQQTDFPWLREMGLACDGACEDCDCDREPDPAPAPPPPVAEATGTEEEDPTPSDEATVSDAPPLAEWPRQALMKVAKERGHEVASTDTKDSLLAKLAEGTTP